MFLSWFQTVFWSDWNREIARKERHRKGNRGGARGWPPRPPGLPRFGEVCSAGRRALTADGFRTNGGRQSLEPAKGEWTASISSGSIFALENDRDALIVVLYFGGNG